MNIQSMTGSHSEHHRRPLMSLEREQMGIPIDNIQVGVILIDAETHHIVDMNAKAESIFGYLREEIVGKNFHEVMTPLGHHESYAKDFMDFVKTSQSPTVGQTLELQALRKDGQEFPVEMSLSSIRTNGKWNVIAIIRDISERKRTDAMLKEAMAELNLINENIPMALMLVDQDRRVRKVNSGAAAFADKTPEDMTGLRSGEALGCLNSLDDPQGCGFGPECQSCSIRESVLGTFRTGIGVTNATRWLPFMVDGKKVKKCLQFSTALLGSNGSSMVLLCAQDVTEQNKAENRIRLEKEKAENYLNLAGVMFVALDMDENITLINPKVHEILETDGADLVGMNWFDNFIPPENRDGVRTVFNRIMAGEVAPEERYENAVITSKGNRRMVAWHNSVLRDEHGQIIGLLSSGEDITEQMTYRDALRESEEKFKLLSNLTFEGIALHDMGLTLDVNESFLRMFGYAREDIIGKNAIHLLFPPEYHGTIKENMAKNYANPYEVMGRRKDGSVFPLEMEARNFEIDGKNIRVVATRDITERKKAEEDIRASEAKYRLLSDNSSDVIWSIDLDGKFQYVSPSVQKLRGFTAEEVMAQSTEETLMPEGIKLFERELAQILEALGTGSELNLNRVFELEQPCKDGTTVWTEVSASMMFDEKGEPVGIQGVSRNSTEHRKMESLLRESEKKFRTMMNSSADAVFITDSEGNYLYVNPKSTEMLGYSAEELTNMNIAQISTKEALEVNLKAFKKLLETGKQYFEIELVKKDGTTVSTDLNAVVMENGQIYGSCRDITERKIAENALKTTQHQLAEAMDMAQLVNWEFDVTTGMFTFDDRFYALYGTTAELEGGHRMSADVYAQKYVHPEDIEVVGNEINKAIQVNDPDYKAQVEHRIIRRDGEVRHIIVRFGIIKDKNGRTIKTRGANQDITERKKMEENMKANLQDLERYKKATIDRELKMVELKEEIRALKEKQRGG